jgi:cephalosporin-C deacetylase-like acetyl esterase
MLKEAESIVCTIAEISLKESSIKGWFAVPRDEEPSIDNIFHIHTWDMEKVKKFDKDDLHTCSVFRYSSSSHFNMAGYVYPAQIKPYAEPKKKKNSSSK